MNGRASNRLKQSWAKLALLSVEMIIVLCLFIIALVVFIFVTRRIFVLHKTQFDNRVFTFLSTHVSNRNSDIMEFFTFLGTHEFLIPANLVLTAWFLFVRKNKWYSIKVPAIALSSLGLMFALKHLFNRPRPDIPLLFEAKGMSFPSGHALMSVTFYGLLVYIVYKNFRNKALKWTMISLLLLLILVIGVSRIYLRVHYASDVIAGFALGFLWLVFAVWLLNRIEKYSLKKLKAVAKDPPGNASMVPGASA